MHLAEGVLPAAHAAFWGAVAAPFVATSVGALRRLEREGEPAERALVLAAAITTFGVTLFPVPMPFVGISSHLCATPVLALLVGARSLVVPTLLALLVQALFFAHGGLSTLGANVVSLGVVGPLVAVSVARGLSALRLPPLGCVGIATALADTAVYLVDAAILAAGLAGERSFGHWFGVVGAALLPVQGPLAVLEGGLSALLVRQLAARRASLVPAWLRRPVALAALGLVLLLAARPVSAEVRGLDEVAFVDTAAAAGRPAADSGEPGELATAFAWAIAFGAGVVFGRLWPVIFREGDLASRS